MSDARPILIVSDLHLGKAPCTVRALEPLLEGVGRFVVNGDAAEIHLPGASDIARDELARLRESCGRAGAELELIEGNHDLGISPLRHAMLAGERVLVTHGDAFDPCVSPWSPWAADARAAVVRVLEGFPPAERDAPDAIFAAARAAAACEWADPVRARRHSGAWSLLWRPHAVWLVLQYWRRYPQLAASFARRCAPTAQVVVCGHSHHPGLWRIDGRVIINTGHFEFPGRPFAVRLKGDAVELLRIERKRGRYRLASAPRAAFTLRPEASTAAASTPVSMPHPSANAQSSSVATFPSAPGA